MYRYQYSDHLSRDVLPAARRNLHKVGRVVRVEAKRYNASCKSLTDATGRTQVRGREVIRVVGTKGTATFTGVSWGYGGEGPRATEALLLMCGVPVTEARYLAFQRPNYGFNNLTGIDWAVDFVGDSTEHYYRPVAQTEVA